MTRCNAPAWPGAPKEITYLGRVVFACIVARIYLGRE